MSGRGDASFSVRPDDRERAGPLVEGNGFLMCRNGAWALSAHKKYASPFAGGLTRYSNDTKTDERRRMNETKRRRESAGAEVLELAENLARMGAARGRGGR